MRAFVIAMADEANAIRHCLGADDRLYVCGIGKVNAAMATQQAIDEGATEVLNLGLCGGFDPSMHIGDVFEVGRAVEYDFDLAQVNHTQVGQLDERDSPYIPVMTAGVYPALTLATGDRFNDSDDDLDLLKALDCRLRDMEGAAIAHVCERHHIPCRMLKCVSDVHGLGGMTGQYLTNREQCLAKLGEATPRFSAFFGR